MLKVVTSYNLNPQLKLYFYAPILANNNMLLKIYCKNIVIAFLNCIYLCFFQPGHTFFFFFFFSLDFSPPHTCTLISTLSFLFSTFQFPLHSRTSLSLSFSSSLSLLFFFYLIPNGERDRKRKNRWVRWLRSTAPSALSPLLVFLPTQPRW